MENRLSDLLKILQKQLAHYRQLSDLLRTEREAVAEAKLSVIQDCVFAKESAIDGIRQREHERLRILGELAFELKIPIKNLNLNQLVLEVQGRFPKLSEQLRSVQVALQLMVQKAHDQNLYNKGLLEKSLMHFHQMKRNVLGEAEEKSQTYSSTGQQRSPGQGARLLSKEG